MAQTATTQTAGALGFKPFDADHHYYEPTDAFTRHIPKEMAKRCIQWAEVKGRPRLLVGGKVSRFIPNPTFHPIAKPGSLYDYFRGKAGADIKSAFGDLDDLADKPEYQQADPRMAVLDAQGLEGCIMLPTLAMGMEHALSHDPPAAAAAFQAFNQWLLEDWGFARDNKIFAAPYMTLADPDHAAAQAKFAADNGARVVVMRAAPPPVTGPPVSPGDPRFDPFWATLAEAGIVVAYHSGDVGLGFMAERWGDQASHKSFSMTPLYSTLTVDRAIFDSLAVLLCHGVFERHPKLKVATIESGSEWLALLFSKMTKAYKRSKDQFFEHPHDTLRQRLWVSPHFEEEKKGVADLLGADRVLMGSDWPHAEGLVEPVEYKVELERDGFAPNEIQMVMRDNAMKMLDLA